VRPRTILLVRHGESVWNAEGRWQGQADPPLSERGLAQAAELAASLRERPIVAVHSSDLARARQTAEPTAAALGLPLVLDPALRELHVGAYQGLTRVELDARYPDWRLQMSEGRPPDGESRAELRARLGPALDRIERDAPAGEILVVSHGAAMRAALDYLREQGGEHDHTLGIANCQVIEVTLDAAAAA
jgi:broad specificity phosphatase PhoE